VNVDWQIVESLIWFYSGAAECDAGVRSVQGGFQDTMQRLALCGRPAKGHASPDGKVWLEGEIPVHESRATASRYDLPIDDDGAISERLIAQVETQLGRRTTETRSGILARLRSLGSHRRATLELQFGDELWFCDGTVWPAQRAALDRRWGVSLALLCCTDLVVAVTEKTNARREKRGSGPVDAREAVVLLLARPDAESKAIVAEMAAEAGRAIAEAMGEYGKGGARVE
jgi:hypothetical protein